MRWENFKFWIILSKKCHPSELCGMRNSYEKIVDRLLLHCSIAHKLWFVFFALFGVLYMMPTKVIYVYSWLESIVWET